MPKKNKKIIYTEDQKIKSKFLLGYYLTCPEKEKIYLTLIDDYINNKKDYKINVLHGIVFKIDLDYLLNIFNITNKNYSIDQQVEFLNNIFFDLKNNSLILPEFKNYIPERKNLKLVEFYLGPDIEKNLFEFHIHKDLKFLITIDKKNILKKELNWKNGK